MMVIFISTAFIFGFGMMAFSTLFNIINEANSYGYDYETNKIAFKVIQRIGPEKIEKAIEDLTKVIELNPKNFL